MSALRDAVEDYVTLRRALGSQIAWAASELRRFAAFAEHEGAEFVTTRLALQWAQRSPRAGPAIQAERLGVVRRFAAWRRTTDLRTEVPPPGLLPNRSRRKPPYMYTDEEVERILVTTARLPSAHGLRGPTFATLFGTLAATGLRLGEALGLDLADVDLRNGILAVRKAKFGKSRFVPLHESTRRALAQYAEIRDRLLLHRAEAAFFVTERGLRVRHGGAEWTFARVSWEIGLRALPPRGCTGRGPRLHDLRHRFAAARLVQWYRDGLDVERELPKLATYLGHAHVRHSYWYLEAFPELLQLASQRLLGERGKVAR